MTLRPTPTNSMACLRTACSMLLFAVPHIPSLRASPRSVPRLASRSTPAPLLSQLIHEQFADLKLDHAVLDAALGSRRVPWAHFGIDCETFSQLASDVNNRKRSNFYMVRARKVGTP